MRTNYNNNAQSDHDTALGWIARFRSESATDEDRQAFALWLQQDPHHKQAMDSMLDMWQDLASISLMDSPMAQGAPRKAANRSKHWLTASIISAACLVLAIFLWPQSSLNTTYQRDYQTALGEQHSIELEDGSIIELNTNSRVSVHYDKNHRRIELLRGEAYFEVTKDSARPFDVNAGSARVTAIGTAFNIYRRDQSTNITVTEGVVRVTETGGTGNRIPATSIVHANQELEATDQGLQAATTTNVSLSTAWQRGTLIAHSMTLTELVRQIERYHDTHILITDSSIATSTISGVFALSDIDPILQALQVSLGLSVVSIDDKTLQLIKAPPKN